METFPDMPWWTDELGNKHSFKWELSPIFEWSVATFVMLNF